MKKILIFLVGIGLSQVYGAEGDILWTKTYNDPNNGGDRGQGIAVDGSGNAYVTGYIAGNGNDIWVRKYESNNGAVIWTGTYTGSSNGDDRGQGIAVDNSGNVYVTGFEYVTGQGSNIWVRKYDTNGNVLWTGTYTSSGEGNDAGQGIAVDSSGNFYVAGYEYMEGQANNIWARKYNSSGTEVWTKTYDNGASSANDEGCSIAVDSSGNVYVTGYRYVADQIYDISLRYKTCPKTYQG